MSTRALISVQLSDDAFIGVYCHHDGYPSYLGDLLLNHYSKNDLKIWELLAVGDMSSADEIPKNCNAYYEPNSMYDNRACDYVPRFHKSIEEMYDYQSDLEYIYVWRASERKWYFVKIRKGFEFKELTQEECDND